MLCLTEHNSELMLQSPKLSPLSLPWLLVCFLLITTSWIPFTDISAPLPLNLCAFHHSLFLCLSLSLSLSHLSALFYKQSSDTVSQRHTFSPALAGCQAGSAMTVGILGSLVDMHMRTHMGIWFWVQTHMHNPEHCANNQSGHSMCLRSIWPHLDLTQDTSPAPSRLIQLDRCAFLCACARAFFLMHILYEAAECMSETRT